MPSPVPISKDLRSSKFINSFSSSEWKLLTRRGSLSAVLQRVSQRIINVCSQGRWSNNVHATEHSCAGSDLLLRYVMVETLCSSHGLENSGFRCPSASFELERAEGQWYSHVFYSFVLCCTDGQYLAKPSPGFCTSTEEVKEVVRWSCAKRWSFRFAGWLKEVKKKKNNSGWLKMEMFCFCELRKNLKETTLFLVFHLLSFLVVNCLQILQENPVAIRKIELLRLEIISAISLGSFG